jgi:PAS domain S-box-containing protein
VGLWEQVLMRKLLKRNDIKRPKIEKKPLPVDDGVSNLTSEEILKLIQREQIFRQIFETSNEAIWIVDLKGKILMANNQVNEFLGYTSEEIIGRTTTDFLIKDRERQIVAKMRKALSKGVKLTNERRLRHKNGSTVYLLVNSSPLLDSTGRHIANICMMSNIPRRKKAEEELRESQKRFQALVENTSDFIWELDPNGVFTYCSPQTKELWGYTPENTIGKTPFDRMLPEDKEQALKAFRDIFGSMRPYNRMETRSIDSRGRTVVIETSGVPFFDDNGSLLGYRGISRDITEKKRAEQALQESEEKHRLLVENANEAVMVFQGTLTKFFNKKALVLTGYTEKELNSLLFEELVYPDDQVLVSTTYLKRLESKTVPQSYDFRIKRKDGSICWVNVSAVLIAWEGKPASLVLFTDITERKHAEEALKSSEEKYRSVAENANESIVIAQDGKIKYFNSKMLEISGYSAEEVKSKSFLDLIYPEDQELVAERHQRRIRGETVTSSYEYRAVRKDGSIRWLHMNTALITWEDKPATLNIISDITEERDLKDQLTEYAHRITQVQEEERKRIAYELHDDTAQYLALLKMQLGALVDSGNIQSPEIKQKLHFLVRDADRAFNDVRRYSHELRPVVLEHHGLAAALEQIADDYIKLGQLSLQVNVEGAEPKLPDEVKLGFFRIAQEALNNTRKHSKARQANIDINFNHKQVLMTVSDNGDGFNTEEALKKSGCKGSLGLLSMRERAKLINADLKIESEPGKGTKVILKAKLQSLDKFK